MKRNLNNCGNKPEDISGNSKSERDEYIVLQGVYQQRKWNEMLVISVMM